MTLWAEYTDGHLRATRGEEYGEEWRGHWVVEMCSAWNGTNPVYGRPDFVERGMAPLRGLFPSREAANEAIHRVLLWAPR